MLEYIEQIKKMEFPSFQKIRSIANKSISHLSKEDRNKLWKNLNHGKNLLDSHELLCQYLCSFGNMHKEKMMDALKRLPMYIYRNEFEIVVNGN